MWPVGLTGGNKAETPVVEDGKVNYLNQIYVPFRNLTQYTSQTRR